MSKNWLNLHTKSFIIFLIIQTKETWRLIKNFLSLLIFIFFSSLTYWMRTNNHVESFKKKVHQSYNRKTLMPHLEKFFLYYFYFLIIFYQAINWGHFNSRLNHWHRLGGKKGFSLCALYFIVVPSHMKSFLSWLHTFQVDNVYCFLVYDIFYQG